jgi:DNA-directed RNA polymerase specialized sigma24 family protein
MNVHQPAISRHRGRAGAAFFASLDHEWRALARSMAFAEQVREWSLREPALATWTVDGAGALCPVALSPVTWDGYEPVGRGAEVLSALLRLATSPPAARALLQALLPRLRSERVQVPAYGHGVGERGQAAADTVADLVAECFAAIVRHAGEDRDDVARLLVQEATRKLRTVRRAQHRYQERTVPMPAAHDGWATTDLTASRSSAEWLAVALTDAVRSQSLTAAQARLVYATRVKGVPASEVGRHHGMRPRAVYYALARAESALLSRVP